MPDRSTKGTLAFLKFDNFWASAKKNIFSVLGEVDENYFTSIFFFLDGKKLTKMMAKSHFFANSHLNIWAFPIFLLLTLQSSCNFQSQIHNKKMAFNKAKSDAESIVNV